MARGLFMMIIMVVVILLPDIYITRSFLKGCPFWVKVLQWVPTLLLVLSFALTATGTANRSLMMTTFFGIILLIVLPKFMFMLFSVIGKIVHLKGAFNIIGLVASIIVCVCALYGLTLGWKRVTTREVELSFKDLPEAFDGYKIVQISDWHLGTYSSAHKTIEKEIALANSSGADMIVFTGDVVNGDPEEMDGFMDVLKTLSAPDGVYSIMGNHDYCMYGSAQSERGMAENISKLQQNERDLGWRLLLNENEIIRRGADSLAIVGVENDGNPPFPQKGDLVKAQKGLKQDCFKVLLSHDPTHWRRAILPDTNIQLTLSGHTHAMQLRFWGFSPSKFVYPEWGGLYQEGDRKLFICTGSGGNVAFRFGSWPEIVKITLRKEQ